MGHFTLLEHPSDVGMEVYGATREELFTTAARGMYSILLGDYTTDNVVSHAVQLEGRDVSNLLLLWLNELLFLFETRRFVFSSSQFQECGTTSLHATVSGEECEDCSVNVGIKAVTYHHLTVEERNGEWYARVYFDV